jgi:uncharacterized protein (UPF0218 family)
MVVAYTVTPELRVRFKKPFGELIQGSYSQTMAAVGEIMSREMPSMLISVGDRVSRNLAEFHMNPKLSIIDNRCMRKSIKPQESTAKHVVHVSNPKGTITEEAIAAISAAFEADKQFQIIVEGEEDLLTLVVVLYAPEKSLVVYGQPREGIVVVRVTSEKKAEAKDFLKAMKTVRKAK